MKNGVSTKKSIKKGKIVKKCSKSKATPSRPRRTKSIFKNEQFLKLIDDRVAQLVKDKIGTINEAVSLRVAKEKRDLEFLFKTTIEKHACPHVIASKEDIFKDTSGKPYYFDVMRPFGKGGYANVKDKFEYVGYPEKQVPLFCQDYALDISLLPYQMAARFITLLPSDALRTLSFTSKHYYGQCLAIRGLEVQVMYPLFEECRDNNMPTFDPLENGRSIVCLKPDTVADRHLRFLPFFKITAMLYVTRSYIYKKPKVEPHTYMATNKSYKNFYCMISDMGQLDFVKPFLHDTIQTMEIKIHQDRHRGNDFDLDINALMKHFEGVKVKNYSLEVSWDISRKCLNGIKRTLVEYKPKSVENLYFCHSPENYYKFGNRHTVSVYDEDSDEWIVQALPDKLSSRPHMRFTPESTTESVIIPLSPLVDKWQNVKQRCCQLDRRKSGC